MSVSPKSKQHSESKEMIQEVDRFVDGIARSVKTKLRMPSDFNRVCICGMGGSAMSGDIIADALTMSWNIPIQVIRSTSIPNWMDERTLVIASSYSGNTRETLMMYDQAKAKGCKMVVITAGGELRDKCLRDSNKLIEVPIGLQPRSAIGYTIGYLANIIQTAGGPKVRDELTRMIPLLRRYRGSIWTRNPESEAKHIAKRLHGTVPAIYADGALSSAAVRWKNQINENSKMIAFNGAIPEMNHNEIVGWSACAHRTKCKPVFLYEEGSSDVQGTIMLESVELLRSSGSDPEVVTIEGRTVLERSLKAVMLGDYVSLFLASMNGVDPMDIEPITSFKKRLAMLLGRKKTDKPKKEKTDRPKKEKTDKKKRSPETDDQ
ncbi:MAG: bifunctional phosphoglucose/phosphomannose isomerase [Methanomassiliicoccaceae archaeon]|nr:bifunctional phosphoglucose/phosphomannose isomerase [Methanomassiliicoccaceae archaeon]